MRIVLFLMMLLCAGCKQGAILSALSGNNSVMGGDCEKNGAYGAISSNHGHILVISADDILISQPKTYDITGAAGHSHTVDLTVDLFNRLALRVPVVLTSSLGAGHTHEVLIQCQ